MNFPAKKSPEKISISKKNSQEKFFEFFFHLKTIKDETFSKINSTFGINKHLFLIVILF